VHGAALLCVALAVILLITPAALHRIVWAGEDSEALLRTGGRVVMAALVPLALGMTGDAYVVFARIFESEAFGAAAAVAVLAALLGLWFAWPMVAHRWPRITDATAGAR
jgi:peptidoglycan biosynthesis protein MviN/MurJ (putative lipid II flippase)